MTSRSEISAIDFFIIGEDDIVNDANATTVHKATFTESIPTPGGLYDPHYGTTEFSWDCQTCYHNKTKCPGHEGMMKINYPLQNALFRKEILKWLKAVCHKCGELVLKKELIESPSKRLTEFGKLVRSSTDRTRICAACQAPQPWVVKDKANPAIIYAETYTKGTKSRTERKAMNNHEIATILNRITDATVERMGKSVSSHPKKLILKNVIKIPSTTIRPEIRKIGGNRSTMSDITALLKNLMEINSQIPRNIPQIIDRDLNAKLVLADLTLFEMIQGSNPGKSNLRLVTNTNKVSHSIANRLPKKTGRLRGNLMGKRTSRMMRSVITGDKALRPDQVGVPQSIAANLWIPMRVGAWNYTKAMMYYKSTTYPKCQKIWRKDTGREHLVSHVGNYTPQYGDIIYRNMVDGDRIGFLREPALIYSSISVLIAKVIRGLTFRLNSAICIGFNVDFDGDEMNGVLIKQPETVAETIITSAIDQWFIGYKDSQPLYGLFQDALIGISELTQTDTAGIDKYHAMCMMNRTTTDQPLVFNKKHYTGRELVSMFLPPINYEGKSWAYVPEFSQYINYNPLDIKVKIRNGIIEQGVLDKESIGQGSEGGIFHNIYLDHGPTQAVNTLYNLQQLANHFLYYVGATFGVKDVYLTRKTREKLKYETAKIIEASKEITRQLDEGKLVAPVGMTVQEYYEDLQMSALDHGDEFIKPIIQEIDPKTNWLYKYIFSGSKGNKSNMMAIYTSIGSIGIKGKRIKQQLGGRTSINYQRGSTDPIARGYNPNNFSEGIDPRTFPFSAMEARSELIEIALSTAVAGTMNRNAVKNLEKIQASNLHGSIKHNTLIQPMYGESGIDPRKMRKVKFNTIKMSDSDLASACRADVKMFDAKWRGSFVQKRLDDEYRQIVADRDEYRNIFMQFEQFSRGNYLLKDVVRMPIDPEKVLRSMPPSTEPLDPVRAIDLVEEYCSSIGYLWMNEIKRKAKAPIPRHVECAATLAKILIRSTLNTTALLAARVGNAGLEQILDRLSYQITNALIEAGTSIGIIAAQCVSEPITQFLLDAKHRSGLKKSKTNTIDRFGELLGNKKTEDLHNPQMILMPRAEWLYDKQRVMEIATHIEMLAVDRFVAEMHIFVEEFGKPVHPDFADESKMISRHRTTTFGDDIPRDLINWCIRFALREDELIMKSMKVETMVNKLMEKFPYLYIAYNQNLMRVYIRSIAFKKNSDIDASSVLYIANSIRQTVVRGVNGITNTTVKSIPHSVINDAGAIEMKKMFVIETDGTNMSAIMENPYLDVYNCVTSSVSEVETLFGIEYARNKMLDEILVTLKDKTVYEHPSVYADEMSYIGKMTSIQRAGLGKREINDVLLRASFGGPVQVFAEAAINSQRDNMTGMSDKLVCGTVPKFGTTYNDIIIDEDRVRELTQSVDDILNAL